MPSLQNMNKISYFSSLEYAWVFVFLMAFPLIQIYLAKIDSKKKKPVVGVVIVSTVAQLFCFYYSFFEELYFISIGTSLLVFFWKKTKVPEMTMAKKLLGKLVTTLSFLFFFIATICVLNYRERVFVDSVKPNQRYVFYRLAFPLGMLGSGSDWDGLISRYEGHILKERFVNSSCGWYLKFKDEEPYRGSGPEKENVEDEIAKYGECPKYR